MKPNWYALISRAVEEGMNLGYAKAYKHTDHPEEEMVKEAMYDGVMYALSEIIQWDEESRNGNH